MFILSYFLNTSLFFPIIYRDLLQYSYNNLNDRIFNFNIDYLLDLSKMLFFKIEIELFLGFFLSFLYFIYNTISKNKILCVFENPLINYTEFFCKKLIFSDNFQLNSPGAEHRNLLLLFLLHNPHFQRLLLQCLSAPILGGSQ